MRGTAKSSKNAPCSGGSSGLAGCGELVQAHPPIEQGIEGPGLLVQGLLKL